MKESTPLAIIVVAFVIGYAIVNWLFGIYRNNSTASKNGSASKGQPPPSSPPKQESREESARKDQERWEEARKEEERRWREEQRRRASETMRFSAEEAKYGAILGLKGKVTPSDVKRAYRELLVKYHPDKVSHLGMEFQKIAEEKTKNIIIAYEFFKNRYGFE